MISHSALLNKSRKIHPLGIFNLVCLDVTVFSPLYKVGMATPMNFNFDK